MPAPFAVRSCLKMPEVRAMPAPPRLAGAATRQRLAFERRVAKAGEPVEFVATRLRGSGIALEL
jgi:hypothetical protein